MLIREVEFLAKITVSCIQMKPKRFDFDTNLKNMCNLVDEAINENEETSLIVFPELITSGYECGKEFYNLAETVPDGRSMKVLGGLAKRYKTNIIYGFPEKDLDVSGVLYNSAVLINDMGEISGVYRKVHPFDTERQYFRAGNKFPIFNTSVGKVGIMICWDTAFPEVARTYALKGADLIVVSTNWEKPYSDDWDLVTRARAFENCIYLAASNRVGYDEKLSFFGHSRIIDPLGKPIKELNDEVEGIISSELDLSLPGKLRQEYYTFFRDRRPDTYGMLTRDL